VFRLTRLVLTDFRGYASLTWQPGTPISVLYGPNGSGKTNLLEAVSLLVPGRGLRGARIAELPRCDGPGTWAVAGRFATQDGDMTIGTGARPEGPSDRRVFRVDGQTPRNQAEVATRAAMVWLTPSMDRLFQDGMSGRRRFLDRLVWGLEPGHAREMAAYDTAMQGRNRLLSEGRHDRAWLAALEDSMARHAVAATAARLGMVGRLNGLLLGGIAGAFPAARIDLLCPIAERLGRQPALAVEDWLRDVLLAHRDRDAAAGASLVGAHRCDVRLTDSTTGIPAERASTGQQKALLVGIILAHAGAVADTRGFAPILLLDEAAVHLDTNRRAALFEALTALPAQTLLTGTDAETFAPLMGRAAMFRVGGGRLTWIEPAVERPVSG
jgi:DNA replication and repair protein RecF